MLLISWEVNETDNQFDMVYKNILWIAESSFHVNLEQFSQTKVGIS